MEFCGKYMYFCQAKLYNQVVKCGAYPWLVFVQWAPENIS